MQKKAVYTLTIAGLLGLVSVVPFLGTFDKERNAPAPITVDGVTIEFPYTDSLDGENLHIYTNKSHYDNGFSGTDVYVAVYNDSGVSQEVTLNGYFRSTNKRVERVQVLTNVTRSVVEPVFGEVCTENVSTTTRRKQTTCQVEQIATTTVPLIETEWVEIPKQKRNTYFESLSLAKSRTERKEVENFVAENTFAYEVGAGEVLYYKMFIKYPPGSADNFYFEAFGSEGAYGHLDPWFNSSWDYRVEVQVNPAYVGSTLTNYPLYIDLSDMPVTFKDHINAGGSDIRVTESDGETETPFEVVFASTTASAGELYVLVDSLSSSATTTLYIYYGNSGASAYAATDTYGRNNVWPDYEVVLHFQEDPSGSAPQFIDSTGNGQNGTTAGSMTSSDSVQGKLAGRAVDCDGIDDNVTIADSVIMGSIFDSYITVWTMSVLYKPNVSNQAFKGGKFPFPGWVFGGLATTNESAHARQTATQEDRMTGSGTVGTSGTWYLSHYTNTASYTATDFKFYTNGVLGTTATTDDGLTAAGNISNAQSFKLCADSDAVRSQVVDEFRIRLSDLGVDWIATEYDNFNTPTPFYWVGTQEENGGGGGGGGGFTGQPVIFFE